MARRCALLGKQTKSGNNRPFSLKATKRTFRPNLFKRRILNPFTGRVEKVKLSAKAIKTLKKWSRECEVEETTDVTANPEKAKTRVKKEKLTPKQKKELAAKEAEVEKASTTEGAEVKGEE